MDVIGTRVVAIRNSDHQAIYIFGRGTYAGLMNPPESMDPLFLNPAIDLDDNAGRVWGYQCWWGPDDEAYERIRAGRPEIVVPIPPNRGVKK